MRHLHRLGWPEHRFTDPAPALGIVHRFHEQPPHAVSLCQLAEHHPVLDHRFQRIRDLHVRSFESSHASLRIRKTLAGRFPPGTRHVLNDPMERNVIPVRQHHRLAIRLRQKAGLFQEERLIFCELHQLPPRFLVNF